MKKDLLWLGLFAALGAFTLDRAPELQQAPNRASAGFAEITPALESVTSDDLLQHITVLASDQFEGRGPGTPGEALTVKYLTEQFKRLGLKPADSEGTYTQQVHFVGIMAYPRAVVHVGNTQRELKSPDDCVALSRRFVLEVNVTPSDLVFVGYGIVAPEYGWDDYKGIDVRGKTLVMLINDPPIPDPIHPAELDEQMFKGRAMTYYGRWTYKYEIASEKEAAAAIIVHESGPAGYPYEVVVNSFGRENFELKTSDNNLKRVAVEAWITLNQARELFTASGQDFDALKQAALRKDFSPVPLGSKVSFNIKNTFRDIESHNVIAKLEGADAKLKEEDVIYTAHWDHLGRDEQLQGDQIFNGALDNASGTAALLELADTVGQRDTPASPGELTQAMAEIVESLVGPVEARALEGKAQERALISCPPRALGLVDLQLQVPLEELTQIGFEAVTRPPAVDDDGKASQYRANRWPRRSSSLFRLSNRMLDNGGDRGDPCRTLSSVGWRLSPTSTPARRYFSIKRSRVLSRTLRATRALKASWETRSKTREIRLLKKPGDYHLEATIVLKVGEAVTANLELGSIKEQTALGEFSISLGKCLLIEVLPDPPKTPGR